MKRGAALLLIALVLLPAIPASACPTIAGIQLSDCDDEKKPRRSKTKAPGHSSGAARAEASLLRDLNAERARRGLSELRSHWVAAEIARAHARTMAQRGTSFHNPNLNSSGTKSRLGWPRSLAENVGHAPSAESIHVAYMRSYGHRKNILNNVYDHVGVGVVKSGRYYYAVEVFLGGARYRSWFGGGGSMRSPGGKHRFPQQFGRVVRATAMLERMLPAIPARITPEIGSLAANASSAMPWRMMMLAMGGLILPGSARAAAALRRRKR